MKSVKRSLDKNQLTANISLSSIYILISEKEWEAEVQVVWLENRKAVLWMQHHFSAIKYKHISICLNSQEIQLISFTSESFKVRLSAQSFESMTANG